MAPKVKRPRPKKAAKIDDIRPRWVGETQQLFEVLHKHVLSSGWMAYSKTTKALQVPSIEKVYGPLVRDLYRLQKNMSFLPPCSSTPSVAWHRRNLA